MAITPEIENTVIVKKMAEAANRIVWIPINEVKEYFIRYPEMLEAIQGLFFHEEIPYSPLRNPGFRLLVQYRYYDNTSRNFNYHIYGDATLYQPDATVVDPEIGGVAVTAAKNHSPFGEWYIDIHRQVEIMHFAFVIVA